MVDQKNISFVERNELPVIPIYFSEPENYIWGMLVLKDKDGKNKMVPHLYFTFWPTVAINLFNITLIIQAKEF